MNHTCILNIDGFVGFDGFVAKYSLSDLYYSLKKFIMKTHKAFVLIATCDFSRFLLCMMWQGETYRIITVAIKLVISKKQIKKHTVKIEVATGLSLLICNRSRTLQVIFLVTFHLNSQDDKLLNPLFRFLFLIVLRMVFVT